MSSTLRVYDSRFEIDEGGSAGSLELSSSFVITKTSGETGAGVDLSDGWRDMIGQITLPLTDQGQPARAAIGDSDFTAPKFTLDTHVWIEYHINHDYKLGTPIYIHVHWLTDGTDTQPVKWMIQYAYAKGHNQANYDFGDGSGTTVYVSQSPPGTPYRHMTSEIVTPISDSSFEPDGIFLVKISRIASGDIGGDNNDGVFAMTFDCHYQTNRIATKNRSPDFDL